MNKLFLTSSLAVISLIAQTSVNAVQPGQIAPPDVNVVDSYKVNLATGQVVQSIPTVSIGGEFGLSHSVRVDANHLVINGFNGYVDPFAGSANYRTVAETTANFVTKQNGVVSLEVVGPTLNDYTRVMNVFGPAGSQDFAVVNNQTGRFVDDPISFPVQDFSYRAVGDQRHTLVSQNIDGQEYLVWTTPDGTVSRYQGSLVDVTYPNGFRVSTTVGAVNTNTGFMLKYNFGQPPGGWLSRNPYEFVAINQAIEHCDGDSLVICDAAQQNWPKATMEWPSGSPTQFRHPGLDPSRYTVTVTDQNGGVTEFEYEPKDVCIDAGVWGSNVSQECTQKYHGDNRYSPRLVSVKSANSLEPDYHYGYRNKGTVTHQDTNFSVGGNPFAYAYWQLSTKVGEISSATNKNHRSTYSNPDMGGPQYGWYQERFGAEGYAKVHSYLPGVLVSAKINKLGTYGYAQPRDGQEYDYDARNFVSSFDPVGPEVAIGYQYDERGNLFKIRQNGITLKEADYPSTCTNTKTCNKPLWIKDARGYKTYYTYHPESGQIATATGPAVTINNVSVTSKTVYEYEQHWAYYKKNSSAIERADSPIWLLTKEFSCRTTNVTSDESGCVGGDMDKIEINYYYGPTDGPAANNLFLRGQSVTAEGNSNSLETRVTCFAYDKYGNKIRETKPKGAGSLTSCQ